MIYAYSKQLKVLYVLKNKKQLIICSEWLKNNYEYVEMANNEYGIENRDIISQTQQAQYYKNNEELYQNIEDIILNYAYNYIINDLKIEEIEEYKIEEIKERLTEIDNNNSTSDIIDIINEVLNVSND